MAKEIFSRLDLRKRTPLQDVIPLDAPIAIQLEVSTICNLRCRFCLHGNDTVMEKASVKKGLFDLNLFKKVIDDFSEFPSTIKSLNLSGVGEPLLNPYLEEMIQYAKQSGKVEFVTFISNATLLTPDRSLSLINAGIDRVDISIYGITSGHYLDLTQKEIEFEDIVENISYFYKNRKNAQISVKAFENALSQSEIDLFYQTFSSITDFIFLQKMGDPFRVETISQIIGEDKINTVNQLVCPLPFYHLFINQAGIVYACCIDYIDNDLKIGDVQTTPLATIWNADRLKDIQRIQLEGRRHTIPSCRNCQYIKTMSGRDNIDPYREQLLKILSEGKNETNG